MQSPNIVICIFAKKIIPAKVKTRLAPLVSFEQAADLARAFLKDTWTLVSGLGWARLVLAVSEAAKEHFELAAQDLIWVLGDGDLGERLEYVSMKALSLPDVDAVILLGSDSPGLPKELLIQAKDMLVEHDAVIGPAQDGGFYLLGLRRCPQALFSDIAWSDARTFENMMGKLNTENFKVKMLDPWFDVDRPEDLLRLKKMLAQGEITALKTHEVIQNIG